MLLHFPPSRCPTCIGPLRTVTADQPALLIHGGYGETRQSVRRSCRQCGWDLLAAVLSLSPRHSSPPAPNAPTLTALPNRTGVNMTDLAGALADTLSLSDFEGLPVRRAAIEIPGAAGGLRDAIKIEPREFHKGERVYVALECVVGKVRFDPIDRDEPAGDQARVHIFMVESATFVDESMVGEALRDQRDRIKRASEAARGVQRLPTDEELLRAHELGEHADDLVDGCIECEREAAAIAGGELDPIRAEGDVTDDPDGDDGGDATTTPIGSARKRASRKRPARTTNKESDGSD